MTVRRPGSAAACVRYDVVWDEVAIATATLNESTVTAVWNTYLHVCAWLQCERVLVRIYKPLL